MEIKLGGDQASAESINVSANGVYFMTRRHIAPLTKLQVTLMLPEAASGDGGTREVVCNGIVVRTEPETPRADAEYEVACYFTSISPDDLADLEAYILSQLAF